MYLGKTSMHILLACPAHIHAEPNVISY